MGLLETIRLWLGFDDDIDRDDSKITTDETTEAEPQLDPNGATETQGKTTDTAVDALKEMRARTVADDTADTDNPVDRDNTP